LRLRWRTGWRVSNTIKACTTVRPDQAGTRRGKVCDAATVAIIAIVEELIVANYRRSR
jgi:hypothetical protein